PQIPRIEGAGWLAHDDRVLIFGEIGDQFFQRNRRRPKKLSAPELPEPRKEIVVCAVSSRDSLPLAFMPEVYSFTSVARPYTSHAGRAARQKGSKTEKRPARAAFGENDV